MFVMRTTEDSTYPICKLVSSKQTLGLEHFALAVYPFGLYGVKPRTLGGQEAGNYPYSTAVFFDMAVVGADPASHLWAFMPACVVPDQEQSLLASPLELVATPPEKLCGG